MSSEQNPFAFQPDLDEPDRAATGAQNQSAFVAPEGLAAICRALLFIYVIILIVTIVSSWMQLDLLTEVKTGPGPGLQQRAEANDARELGILGIRLLAFVITGILSLRLLHRLRSNVDHLGAIGLESSPGWSIGWFFVPIANLWKPLRATTETWKASHKPDSWQSVESPGSIVAWWIFWILSGIVGRISSQVAADAAEVDRLIMATQTAIICSVLALVATFLFRSILGQMSTAQMRAFEQLHSAENSNPTTF